MFARNKDILVLQEELDSLEEKARASNNHLVDTVEEIQTVVEEIGESIEDNEVNINELGYKFDALCQHLGVSIEYKGEQRTYDVTTTETSNN